MLPVPLSRPLLAALGLVVIAGVAIAVTHALTGHAGMIDVAGLGALSVVVTMVMR